VHQTGKIMIAECGLDGRSTNIYSYVIAEAWIPEGWDVDIMILCPSMMREALESLHFLED